MLSRDASDISVGDIIDAAQGPIVPVKCLEDKGVCEFKDCDITERCITRHVWLETQRLLVDYYQSVKIADLCAIARKHGLSRELDHKYMYFI
jgi:DNA-binding IscR family transcriptional regulator